MTKEEAIEQITAEKSYIEDIPGSTKTVKALEMAIKALKQPEIVRCEDCVFREGSCCSYSAGYLWADGFCHRGTKG